MQLSPVAKELFRSRLQRGNYLFSQSSSAGDLSMVIRSLSFSIAVTDMFKLSFQSVIPSVWYCAKTQQSVIVFLVPVRYQK